MERSEPSPTEYLSSPKRMKKVTSKRHKGRVSQVPRTSQVREGEYSLISTTTGRITAKQLTSLQMTVKRVVPTGTTIIPRVFAKYPVTAKPLEVRMGKGKGSIDHYIARVRYNTVLLELAGTKAGVDYKEMLRLASTKLPVSTRVLTP